MKAVCGWVLLGVLSVAGIASGQTVHYTGHSRLTQWAETRKHSFYLGMGGGPTQLSTVDNERNMEGINFSFDTEVSDLGTCFFLGYWITDHVGVEAGTRNYGTIDVPFTFSDPHDSSSGSGESEVTIDGSSVALMLGFDPVDSVQVYARAGALMWNESFDSRFDIAGEPAIRRETEDSGTGMLLGAGVSWRFHTGWRFQLQYEHATLGEDTAGMASLGLVYDFLGFVQE